MTVTINGTTGITSPEVVLDNAAADGGQVVLKSSGYSNWNWDNYSGRLRAYYNATEYFTITNSGNLGLGVTPSAWATLLPVQVKNGYLAGYLNRVYVGANNYYDGANSKYIASDYATRYYQNAGQHVWETSASGTAGNPITWTQAMTLDANGNLLVGRTSQYSDSRISSNGWTYLKQISASAYGYVAEASSNDAWLRMGHNGTVAIIGSTYNSSAGFTPLTFTTSDVERARIDTSGNWLVGTTTSSARTTIQSPSATSTIYAYQTTTSTGETLFAGASDLTSTNSVKVRIYTNGNIQNTNNSYGALSDIKLKENISDATPKLAELMQVKVRNYNLIGDTTKQIGVIAQELEQVFPSMVEETPDRDADGNDLGTTTKGVKYSVFVPMLVKAIQEQQALITSLTARIEALEAKNA